jgi:iron complex outermembrane recepter protein
VTRAHYLTRPLIALGASLFACAGARAQATAPDSAASAPATTLQPVVVTGSAEGSQGYLPVKPSAGGNKLELNLREQANVVNLVPRQLLEDTGATTVHQALETVAGIRPVAPAYTSVSTGIRSRGFESNDTFVNGIRLGAFGHPVDTANIESLEVLKGPASIQYGLTDPGGTLNITTKRPVAMPLARGRFIAGSDEGYRTELDVGGALGPAAATRLNLAYEDSREHRDFDRRKLFLFAPAASFTFGADTTLDLEFNYLRNQFRFNRGLPPFDFILTLPRRFSFQEPNQPLSDQTSTSFFSTLEHALGSSGWKLRQRIGVMNTNAEVNEINTDYDSIDGSGIADRTYFDTDQRDRYWTVQHELAGEFSTGSVKHKLLVGIEFSKTDFGYSFFGVADPADEIPPLDVRNPSYGGYRFPTRAELINAFPGEHYGNRIAALYADWHATLSPQWKLQAGVRADEARGFYEYLDGSFDYGAPKTRGVSPRAGIVFTPQPATDVFANFSTGFVPQIFADSAGTVFSDPEKSRQIEAGLRHEFVPGRLRGTAAVYRITKRNVQVPDPADPTGRSNRLSGEQQSKGFELELAGAVTPQWDLSAGFARVDAKVTQDTVAANVGNELVDAPRNHLALFTKYRLGALLPGAWVGYGLARVSDRVSSSFNPAFRLPAYTRHDLVFAYATGPLGVQLNLGNVGDERIYYTHGNNIHLQQGANAKLTVDYRFR